MYCVECLLQPARLAPISFSANHLRAFRDQTYCNASIVHDSGVEAARRWFMVPTAKPRVQVEAE